MVLKDVNTPGSDDWWLNRLATKLGQDYPRLERLRSYRDGDVAIPLEAAAGVRDAYVRFLRLSRLNFAELIVAAMTSRMIPVAYKTAAAGDDNGDKVAAQIMRASHMGVQMRDHLDDMATYGRAGFLVDGPESVGGMSPIARVSPWEFAVEADPWRPWVSTAAIRVGWDVEAGQDTLTLYRGNRVRVAVRDGRSSGFSQIVGRGAAVQARRSTSIAGRKVVRAWAPGDQWTWVDDGAVLPWTDQVPLVQAESRDGMGTFEGHLDALDRVNHVILQRLIIVAMQAFRQRAVKGNLPQTYPTGHPQAGQRVNYDEVFEAGPAALWMLPEDADIWESGVTDITPILNSAKDDLKNLAAVTSTPLYALSPDLAAGSATGAAVSREMLITKVEEWIERATDALTTTLSLAFLAMGDTVRGDVSQLEVTWRPVDRSSLVERAASAAQMRAAGAPFRLIMSMALQLSPAEIEQAELDRTADAFLAGLATPTSNVGTNVNVQ